MATLYQCWGRGSCPAPVLPVLGDGVNDGDGEQPMRSVVTSSRLKKMTPKSEQARPERHNFDHTQCYRESLHENSLAGREKCRREGPASQRTDRVYSAAKRKRD